MRFADAGRVIPALSLAIALAGCGTSLDPTGGGGGSLFSFGRAPAPAPVAAPEAKKEIDKVDCPHVEVLEGASALRVGGASNESVRYQYSMGELARECTVVGKQISIKVGVQGRVLIGPAGSPGSFSVPVRISIRNEKDQKAAASKFYRVAANVPSGETQADFTIVSEPLLVPLISESADEDYTVLVCFEQSGGSAAAVRPRRRRQR